MLNSILKVIRGIVKLRGTTDNTLIGNVGDRLKVETSVTGSANISSKFRVEFNQSTQTVTNPTLTTIFTYSGSGLLFGFYLDTSQDDTQIKLTVDSDVIFSGITVKSLKDAGMQVTSDAQLAQIFLAVTAGSNFAFMSQYPIKYTSLVKIEATRSSAGSSDIRRTLVYLTKET